MNYTHLKFIVTYTSLLILTAARSQVTITKSPFHIHYTSEATKVMDDQMLRYLSRYGSVITIRGASNSLVPPKWNNPRGYWDSAVFARIEQLNPSVITGLYTKLEIWDSGFNSTFDYETLHGMGDLGVPVLVPDPNNHSIPMVSSEGFFYGDVRNKKFRKWILGRLDTALNITIKTDGFFLDHTWYDPVTPFFPPPYNTDPNMISSFVDSNYTLVKQVKQKFPSAYIQLAGISTQTCMEQIKLLDFADAQNLQSFGITEEGDSNFYSAVLPYIKMLDTPTVAAKRFNVFGTGHGSGGQAYGYVFYKDEKKWERYLFGCFLLGANNKSGFNFRSSQGYPLKSAGRFGEFDVHTDYIYNRLGNATTHFSVLNNGLYKRNFKNGFVLLAPTEPAKQYHYKLNQVYYDNEGNAYSGTITLHPGEAYILYKVKQPDLPCSFEINFEDSSSVANFMGYGLAYTPNTAIKQENNGNHYVSFTNIDTSKYDIFEHDVMLDWVRYQNRDLTFSFRYKTKSTNANIQLYCEVDDTATQKYYNGVINFSVQVPPPVSLVVGYAYRSLSTNLPKNIPNVQYAVSLVNDGKWHTVTINGSELLSAGLQFIRPHFMRVTGTISMDDVIVTHSVCEPGFQLAKN